MKFCNFLFVALIPLGLEAQEELPRWEIASGLTPSAAVEALSQPEIVRSRSSANITRASISRQDAASSLGNATLLGAAPTPIVAGNEADLITPEIQELACGLQFDPVKIFEYVRNYIVYEPYYGSKKGAHLTLLEGSGNDFDQSALLVALLRASGKNAQYQFAACDFSYAELVDWMGVSPTPYSHFSDAQFFSYYNITAANLTSNPLKTRKRLMIFEFLNTRGFFKIDPYTDGDEEIFSIPHVWVKYVDNGVTRNLSPSFKAYDRIDGIDLATATGYSRSQLLADAGGVITTNPATATSLNESAIHTRMNSYSQALLSYVNNNLHTKHAEELVGKREVFLHTYNTLAAVDPIYIYTNCPWLTLSTWSAIPVEQMSKLQITCGTGIFNPATDSFTTTLLNQTLTMPSLRGRKISLYYSGNTARFRLDESALGTAFTASDASFQVRLRATHNHYERSYDAVTQAYINTNIGKHTQQEIKTYYKGDNNAYTFVYSFDNAEKLARARQQVLDQYRRDGIVETDWRIRTELLNIIGLQWYHQTWLFNRSLANAADMLPCVHHKFGRVAQDTGLFIDVGLSFGAVSHRSNDERKKWQFHRANSLVMSAMEHGVIEQMQGESANAVSTIKMIQLANAQAIPIHNASATNWSAINSLFTTYSANVKTTIENSLNNSGADVYIPQNGSISPLPGMASTQWRGYGYAEFSPTSSAAYISGGYSGGYNVSQDQVNIQQILTWMKADPSYTISASTILPTATHPLTTPTMLASDPVDMVSGAFVLDKNEMSLGSGSSPRGLTLARHYNSNRRYDDNPGMGYGWTHNYHITAAKRSSVKAGLGQTIPQHAAAMFTAIHALKDLSTRHTTDYFTANSSLNTLTIPKHDFIEGDRVRVHTAYASPSALPTPLSKTTLYYARIIDANTIKLSTTPTGTTINLTSIGLDTSSQPGGTHYIHRDFTAKEFTTMALISNWMVDRLKYNAVAISLGNKTIEFIKAPDGSYIAPAGMNYTLTSTGSGASQSFTLTERHGSTYTFLPNGNIATITDLWNKNLSFQYNASGQLTTVTDGYNRTFTYTWSGGLIDKITDSTGRIVDFTYTVDNLTSVTDVEGKIWHYQYDAEHRITQTQDPSLRTIVTNTYDSESRIHKQYTHGDLTKEWTFCYSGYCNIEESPLGGKTCYLFDERGRAVGTVTPLKNRTDANYDGHDRPTYTISPKLEVNILYHNVDNNLTSSLDPLGDDTTNTYDTQKRPLSTTDKRGSVTTINAYNATHQATQVTAPLNRTTQTTYTSTGEINTITDAQNNVTDYDYDALGRLTTTKINGNLISTLTYSDQRGDPSSITDANGNTTTFTYNKRRQLLTTTLPPILGQPAAVITHTYNNEGLLHTTTDALGNITTHTYTATGKAHTSTQPAISTPSGAQSNTITHQYDIRDWLATVTDSLGRITTSNYDADGRVTQTIDPLNRSASTQYDKNARPILLTDPLGRQNQSTYTVRGEPSTSKNALLHTTFNTYDGNGNLITYANKRGKLYTYTYDAANRLTNLASPTGKNYAQTYYANDQLHTITEPSGQSTTHTYDSYNRLHTKTDPLATITHGYDANSNLTSVTQGAATIQRSYDARNRLKTYINDLGEPLHYEYDANGNLTKLTYPPDAAHPTGKTVTYTYNARNQLETVTDWANRSTTYQYDRAGRNTKIIRANGTTCIIQHDNADQITSIKETNPSTILSWLHFRHDAAGQITQRTRAPRILPSSAAPATQPPFAATYDDDNRLTSLNGLTVTHDPDGNMTHGPLSPSSGNLNLTYNSRNQLTNASGTTYTYDAEGIRKTIATTSGTTRYTTDPNATLSRHLIKHNIDGSKTYYVYGIGLLYEVNQAEQTKTYHYDQVGSTILRTNDLGQKIGCAEYAPYGETIHSEGDMATPFLYNGQYGVQTDANGLLHMRARYYSPYLMRFLNADPIGFSGGSNWFAYADGNPISKNDPFGLVAWGLPSQYSQSAEYREGFHQGMAQGAVIGTAMVVGGAVTYATAGAAAPYVAAVVGNVSTATVITGTIAGVAGGGASQLTTNALTGQDLGSNMDSAILYGGAFGAVGATLGNSISAFRQGYGSANFGAYVTANAPAVQRTLPKDKNGILQPDVDAPHTQLGRSTRSHGAEPQAREWMYDSQGRLVPTRDIDFTDHNMPSIHPNPHQHTLTPANPNNPVRGGFHRGMPKPLK